MLSAGVVVVLIQAGHPIACFSGKLDRLLDANFNVAIYNVADLKKYYLPESRYKA